MLTGQDAPFVRGEHDAFPERLFLKDLSMTENEIWAVLESMQGEIAREVRVMLGEEQLDQKMFDQAQRDRRIEALKKCAAEATSDADRHLSWMKMHEENGWVYGDEFNPTLKTHPNMKPWDELPRATRSKAKIFDIVAKAGAKLTV